MTPVFSFSEYIYLLRTNLLRTQQLLGWPTVDEK